MARKYPTNAIDVDAMKIVASMPVFDSLPPDERWLLAHTVRAERVARGIPFFRQGGPATDVLVLVRGGVKLMQSSDDPEPFVLRVIGPLTIFGTDTVARQPTYTVSAEALCPSEALVWKDTTILRMMDDHPRFASSLLGIFMSRLEDWRIRYRELATEPVEQRLARALLRLGAGWRSVGGPPDGNDNGGTFDLPLSRRDLAQFVGTTMYTVSRTLQRWERDGIIRSGRMHVTLLSATALRDECAYQVEQPLSRPA